MKKKYDFIIIGSGVGGSTLARELSKTDKDVLVVEKGEYESKYGTFADAVRYFDANRITKIPLKSKEGVIIYRALMAGGSGFVSTGNMYRAFEKEFSELGIELADEYSEAEQEINVKLLSDELISDSSKTIATVAIELGHDMQPLRKAIDEKKCTRCGLCTLGCKAGARWTPVEYLEEAMENGVEVLFNANAQKIIIENGKTKGVLIHTESEERRILGDTVILAAGGLGTPVVLQASGIEEAGDNLFIDIFVNIYGVSESLSMANEPQMAMGIMDYHDSEGFLLATFFNHPRGIRMIEAGTKGFTMPTNKIVGFMNKISDEASGRVFPDGHISKKVTDLDKKKINAGITMAKEILIKAGVDPRTIIVTHPGGAHPGGTASVGKVVDINLETKIKNLYVCDASVFPKAPGSPPILTIIALAKRLAKHIK